MRIKHKGVRTLYDQDFARHLPRELVPKLRRTLTLLDETKYAIDLGSQPGFRLHRSKQDLSGSWSVSVSGIGV